MRILKLTPELANQIAAGEVVERPSAVIKELLENSLDAQATKIDIDLERGGTQLINIRDNGKGIWKDDLHLALARHATSKIKSLTDLESVRSLGFRGEALASISSVSKLRLISKPAEQEQGWQVQVEGQERLPSLMPQAHPMGTTVEVRDLFFNTPARRKFMRSEKTEYAHIEEVIKRFALSHFEVELKVRHQQRDVLHLLPAKTELEQEDRIVKIWGQSFIKQAIVIDAKAEGLHLRGWLGEPSFSRSQNDFQYIYLNQRIVRDRVLNHAIRQAYQDRIYEGRHPAFILYLEVDPQSVDVNVHPTKHEVRFRESRLVHDFLFRAIFDALEQVQESALPDIESFRLSRLISPSEGCINTTTRIDATFPRADQSGKSKSEARSIYHKEIVAPAFEKKQNIIAQDQTILPRFIGMVRDRFYLLECDSTLCILDGEKAHYYFFHEDLSADYEQGAIPSFERSDLREIKLNNLLITICEKHEATLQRLGFFVEILGEHAIVLRAIPKQLAALPVERHFETLLYALNDQPPLQALSDFFKLLVQDFPCDQVQWQTVYARVRSSRDYDLICQEIALR